MSQPLASTQITLDRERTLRFDYDALNHISGLSVADLGGDRSPLDIWRLAGGMNTRAMAIMLWASSKHEDPSVTIDGMRRALTNALKNRLITWKVLNERLNAAINQSECLGLFQATADDDEDTAGNAPAPAPSLTRTPAAGEGDSSGD